MSREIMQQALDALKDYHKADDDRLAVAMDILHQALAQPEQEPDACVKKLNTMIIGCDDVISEDGVHKDAKSLAKLVKKDCYEILQNLEEKNGAL